MDFDITVTVDTSAAQAGGNATQGDGSADALPPVSQVTLDPSRPAASTAGGRVSAQLTGDLMPYRAFPVLTSQLLLMPALSSVSQLSPAEWMLLDRGMVTLDGSECNKIGVGFSAFRSVSLPC